MKKRKTRTQRDVDEQKKRRGYDSIMKRHETAQAQRRSRGDHWWVGGQLKDSRGRIKEALVRASSEQEANDLAFSKFLPTPPPDIFTTTVRDTTEANRIYRMRMAEKRDMLLGDTLARRRHRGKDIGID